MQQLCFLAVLLIYTTGQAAGMDDQIKCSTEGRKFAKEWKAENKPNSAFRDALVDNAEFHFNKALKTCLVYTAVTEGALEKDSTAIWRYKRVTDIYSNRVLVYTRYMTDKKTKKETYIPLENVGDARLVTNNDFARLKDEYFSE